MNKFDKKEIKKLNLIYFANIRLPSERAHSIQIIEMCEALGKLGHEVTLVVPKEKSQNIEDIQEVYQIDQHFRVVRIGGLFLMQNLQVGSYIQVILFSIAATIYALLRPMSSVIYIKDEHIVYFLSFFSRKIFWEPHVGNMDFTAERLSKNARGIIALTQGVKQALSDQGVDSQKMIVAHDAVRVEMFNIDEIQTISREKLNLPLNKKIVMYTGHLFEWKGVYTLAEAASYFSLDTIFVFVGGLPDDVHAFKEKNKNAKNILVLGTKSRLEMPSYLSAADILVLPNSAKTEISRSYTSPLKLFEYMTAKRPIVASDLPSLREVLDESNSFLVPPDNPYELAEAIRKLDVSSQVTKDKVERAYGISVQSTWYNRAEKITKFILEHS